MDVDSFYSLEEIAPDNPARYYVILNKTGFVRMDDERYFLISNGICIPTNGEDCTEIVNEFLDDFCADDGSEQAFFDDPIVLFVDHCNPKMLAEVEYIDYFLLVPSINSNVLSGYEMHAADSTNALIFKIEAVMKARQELEIEDLILFRGVEVPISLQISPTFDQDAYDIDLGTEDTQWVQL